METKTFTPEIINELKGNEIFVFGSNKLGNHAGGAARVAYENFEATWGYAEGLTGRSYALPTLNEEMERVTKEELQESIDIFIEFAMNNPNLTFYLTKIGCGIAGWSIEEVKTIFWETAKLTNVNFDCYENLPSNIIIPKEFAL